MNTVPSKKLSTAKAELVQRSKTLSGAVLRPLEPNSQQRPGQQAVKRRASSVESEESFLPPPKAASREERFTQTADIWLPHAAKYLSFNDLNNLCSVSRDLRRACLEGLAAEYQRVLEAMLVRIQEPLNGHHSLTAQQEWAHRAVRQVYWLAKGDSNFIRRLVCVCRDIERSCCQLGSVTSYWRFMDSGIAVARALRRLERHIPEIVQEMTSLKPEWIDLSVEWGRQTTGPEAVARFLLVVLCAVGRIAGSAPDGSAGRRVGRLRLVYETKGEYAIFIDPIQNTVHVSVLDLRLLSEQLWGAIESLAHFNDRCGYCGTLGAVEEGVKRLLGVSEVLRDARLSDAEHAHCLFKLAVYSHVIGKRLNGLAIMPSNVFEVKHIEGRIVAKFNWSASWYTQANRMNRREESVAELIQRIEQNNNSDDDDDNDNVNFNDNEEEDGGGGDTDELEDFVSLFTE